MKVPAGALHSITEDVRMKKIIILLLLVSLAFAQWDDCPLGMVNDTYPGECSRYIDTNGDGICDHSQPAPEGSVALTEDELHDLIAGQDVKNMTVLGVALIYNIDAEEYASALQDEFGGEITPQSHFLDLHGDFRVDPSTAKDIAVAMVGDSPIALQQIQGIEQVQEIEEVRRTDYNLFPITLILLLAYAGTWALTKKKKLGVATHRKIWNVLLLAFFLVSGILGIILVLRISHGLQFDLLKNMLFLHVETGIAMAVICVFHTAWHWPYFKNLLRK